ncbi:MAG: NADPH-dependent 7-cyano-7-deazaguanine reductase QueF [Burkholderiaceae bacterium]
MPDPLLAQIPLGHAVAYPKSYDSRLLFPISRQEKRQTLPNRYEWIGADIWNAYEISWLNPHGKPVVGTARFTFPQASPNLIESKSFKLYLNSFNETHFENSETARRRMERDLSQAAGDQVDVNIDVGRTQKSVAQALGGVCIDDADVVIDTYQRTPDLLHCIPNACTVTETLMSDLLKSNCPVTGQPDWGSVQIRYTGPQIDRAALLKYIVSFRRHDGFHEHCVEQMYSDIWQACRPESLLIYARYTRRGGLDINPWRSSAPAEVSQARTFRQ